MQEHTSSAAPTHARSQLWLVELALMVAGGVLFACSLLVFARRAYDGLTLFEFGDESEKFVIAQMLVSGRRLYADIFSQHGPLPSLLAHLYAAAFDASDFSYARVIVIGFASLSVLAIVTSPALRTRASRLWATALFVACVSSFWVVQSLQMLLYQGLAGFLFVVVLAQLALPLYVGHPIERRNAFAAGAALALACSCAYVYALASFLLLVFCVAAILADKPGWPVIGSVATFFCLGLGCALVGVAAWLIVFGDIAGYAIYHLYLNQQIYSRYIYFSPWNFMNALGFSTRPEHLVQSFCVVVLTASVIALATKRTWRLQAAAWRPLVALPLLAGALLSMNARGSTGFHNATFVVSVLAVAAITVASIIGDGLRDRALASVCAAVAAVVMVVAVEVVGRTATTTPHGAARGNYYYGKLGRADDPLSRVIRAVTAVDEPMEALLFAPALYLLAGRLPASGHFGYSPWQADYSRAPVGAHNMRICDDIRLNRPPVIWFDNWKFWDRWYIVDYEPCVIQILDEDYSLLPKYPNVYVRNDKFHDAHAFTSR